MNRITVVTGHFGSGKTEFSVNYAIQLKKRFDKVTIVDMDTVNPYYRTKDVQEILEAKGIRVIAPQFANTNVDILSVPSDILSVFDDPECVAVFDVGGDDEGAIVLGMYQRYLLQCGYDMLFVFNARRPLTATGDDTLEMFEAIQNTSRLRFSGIINNTNLMEDTTPEIVLEGQQAAQELSQTTGVPIRYITGMPENFTLLQNEKDKFFELDFFIKRPF